MPAARLSLVRLGRRPAVRQSLMLTGRCTVSFAYFFRRSRSRSSISWQRQMCGNAATYTYDDLGHVHAATSADGKTTYEYDANGNKTDGHVADHCGTAPCRRPRQTKAAFHDSGRNHHSEVRWRICPIANRNSRWKSDSHSGDRAGRPDADRGHVSFEHCCCRAGNHFGTSAPPRRLLHRSRSKRLLRDR